MDDAGVRRIAKRRGLPRFTKASSADRPTFMVEIAGAPHAYGFVW
jgi:hypothetical protein